MRAAKDLNKQVVKQVPWLDDDLWRTDEEFGRQVLNGYHPVAIEKCIELPSNFAVRNEHVNGLLSRNLSLEEEIELGNVYIINCKIMKRNCLQFHSKNHEKVIFSALQNDITILTLFH